MSEGKFPRDFVLNGVDIRAPGIQLGAGTRVQIGTPKMREFPREKPLGINDIDIEVTVPVVLTFRVCVSRGLDHNKCAICGSTPPMPDEEALIFLLRNHDYERIVWPESESTEEERDRYPVPGWRKHVDREADEEGLVCPECYAELQEAKNEIKARRGK